MFGNNISKNRGKSQNTPPQKKTRKQNIPKEEAKIQNPSGQAEINTNQCKIGI